MQTEKVMTLSLFFPFMQVNINVIVTTEMCVGNVGYVYML